MARTTVRGDTEIARGIGNTISDLDRLDRVSADVAERLRTEAARAAPRRSGRLAASGRVSRSGTASVVSFGNAAVQYAGALNFGVGPRTGLRGPHNIRATRYFSNAIRDARADAPDPEYGREIDKSLNRIKGA